MCLQSCAVTFCSSVLSAGSVSLFFHCALLVTLPMVGVRRARVYVCVKPVAFCALTSVCLSLWLIPASRACVCSICVCLSACVCVFVCKADVPRAVPLLSHSHTTHTHTALRKINQHFIYPFASWICPHPPSKTHQSSLIPGSKEYRRKGKKRVLNWS